MNKTQEQLRAVSEQQAEIIIQIKFWMASLDIEHLEQALERWDEDLSFRESAVILASNVDAAMAKNELDRLLIKQLRLVIEFAKREQEIAALKQRRGEAELQRRAVDRIFGL